MFVDKFLTTMHICIFMDDENTEKCAMPISTGRISLLALGILALSGCAVGPYGGYGNQGYNQPPPPPPPGQGPGQYNNGYGSPPPPPPGQGPGQYNNGYGNPPPPPPPAP